MTFTGPPWVYKPTNKTDFNVLAPRVDTFTNKYVCTCVCVCMSIYVCMPVNNGTIYFRSLTQI